MKLVINIPCFNEEETLLSVLKELPKKIEGINQIEVQIVNDGSTDKTIEVAKKFGVARIIRHKNNLGLGIAFKHGLDAALEAGADIFVNTDADNQYPARYIASLVKPIIGERADIVIGNRRPWQIKHFSYLKRLLQYIGNGITRRILGVDAPDTVSGFRAYSKEAMLKLNVVTKFSYVLDTLIQAENKGLKIENVSITTNATTRKSRLFTNIFQHIRKSGVNLMRLFYLYEPFKTFSILAAICFVPGAFLFVRFFWYYFNGNGSHIQSLVISAILLLASLLKFGLGIIGDTIKTNRMIDEDHLYLMKKEMYGK